MVLFWWRLLACVESSIGLRCLVTCGCCRCWDPQQALQRINNYIYGCTSDMLDHLFTSISQSKYISCSSGFQRQKGHVETFPAIFITTLGKDCRRASVYPTHKCYECEKKPFACKVGRSLPCVWMAIRCAHLFCICRFFCFRKKSHFETTKRQFSIGGRPTLNEFRK